MEPRRYGNAHPNLTPYEAFRARDHWFVLGVANSKQWKLLCEVIGHPELKDDHRFSSNEDRLANREELLNILSEILITRDADEWLAALTKIGLPCGPINSIPDVFNHPQAKVREFAMSTEHPTAGAVRLAGFPYKLSETPAEIHRPPPLLGEHTEKILVEILGYSSDDVSILRDHGAI